MPRPTGFFGLALALVVSAASAAEPPGRWEAIPPGQLTQPKPLLDPAADAEVLLWRVWVNDRLSSARELEQTRRNVVRIKVFTDAGARRYARVDLTHELGEETVTDVRARTIQPDGSVVEMDSRSVVVDAMARRRGKGVGRVSFVLPAVRAGAIVEYAWTLIRRGERVMVSWYEFQREIPVQRVVYYRAQLSVPGFFLRRLTFHADPVSSPTPTDGYWEVEAMNQGAVVDEPYSPPLGQRRGWMLTYYTLEDMVHPRKYWPQLGRELANDFESQTRPDAAAQALARQITAGSADDSSRLVAIDRWLCGSFRLLGSLAADTLRAAKLERVDDARAALAQRGGGVYDLCRVFAMLARAAGADVRLLRVPLARDFFFHAGMMNPSFVPSFQIAVRVGGGWRCYDPSARMLPLGCVPAEEEGQLALFCDPDSSAFLRTPVAYPSDSELRRWGTMQVREDGTAEGDLTIRVSGHLNERWRSNLEGRTGAVLDTTVMALADWDVEGLRLSDVRIVPGPDTRAPLEVRCRVALDDFAALTGKRLIVEPAGWHARRPARFTSDTRRNEIYFEHAWSEFDSLVWRAPDGWTLEAVDSPEAVDAPGMAHYGVQALSNEQTGEVLWVRRFAFGEDGTLLFPTSAYAGLKRLFEHVHERDRATVTFVRPGGAR